MLDGGTKMEMKVTIDKFIGIFENAFSKEYCENLIKCYDIAIEAGYGRTRQENEAFNKLQKADTQIFNELDNILLKYKKLITTIIISCLFLNFYYNYEIRDELSAIEYNERIKPVVQSLKLITKDDIIVTDRSVLFQMFGKEDIFIVDITAIGMDEIKTLNVLKNSKRIYYMKDEELDKRYSIKNYFEQNNKFTFKKRLSTHYVLLETN
jgi:hypothetical protein